MPIRNRMRRAAVPLTAAAFVASACLWVWTSDIFYRRLPTPGCAVSLPFVGLQTCAVEDGVHFGAMKQPARQFPEIQMGLSAHGRGGYHHGCVVNILGLVIVVSPTEFDGGDYRVPPHVAAVLPYWLLVVGFGGLLIYLTPLAAALSRYGRLSKATTVLAILVVLVFVALNVIPSAWRPGSAIRPQTFDEWVTLTLTPRSAYSEIMLVYGFPFRCYEKGIINGQVVIMFYGAEVGWKPHKAMENVSVALLAAFTIAAAAQGIRSLATRFLTRQAVQSDPVNEGDS